MRRSSLVIALLGVVAIHAILLGISYVPTQKAFWGDEEMYWEIAVDRAADGERTVELLWPPLYPRLLAWIARGTSGSLLAVQIAQLALFVGAVLLLRDLWRRLVAADVTADLFALAMLAWPPFAAFAYYVWPEALHLFLFALALWVLALRRDRAEWLVGLGVVLGLALLTKSILLPFLPVLLAPVVVGCAGWREGGGRLLLVLAALVLTVAPTVFDNHRREGIWGIAASGRFNLWVGLNDTSRRPFVNEIVGREYQTWRQSAPAVVERNAILDDKIREHVAATGWPALVAGQVGRQYFRLLDKDSFLTLQLPGGAVHDRGKGYRNPPPALAAVLRAVSYAGWAFLLVAAPLGIALCPPRGRGFVWVVLAFLAYHAALFLFVHAKTRYRFPFVPFLIGYTIVVLAGWRGWRRGRPGPLGFEPTPWRLAAGGMGAALGLFFAFGGAWLDG